MRISDWSSDVCSSDLHLIINPLLCGSVVVFCHNDQVPELSTYLSGSFERFAICNWIKSNPMPVANKHYQPDCAIYIPAWNRGHHPQGALADKTRHSLATVGRRAAFGHPTVKHDSVMSTIGRNQDPSNLRDAFTGQAS